MNKCCGELWEALLLFCGKYMNQATGLCVIYEKMLLIRVRFATNLL